MIIAATIFVVYSHDDKKRNNTDYQTAAVANEQKDKDALFGLSPEDWTAIFTAVLAFFTVVLSLSTVGLWIVTWRSEVRQSRHTIKSLTIARRSANAALAQSKAVIAVELPSIEIAEFRLLGVHDIKSTGGVIISPGQGISEICGLKVRFRNSGRTSATLVEQSAILTVAVIPPPTPIYKIVSYFSPGTLLKCGDATEGLIGNNFVIGAENARDILAGKQFLWAYGYLKYLDFMGTPHETKFCAKWLGIHPYFGTAIGFVYDADTPSDYIKGY